MLLCEIKYFKIQREAGDLRMRLICHLGPGTQRGKMCFCVALGISTPQWTPQWRLIDT